VAKLNISRYFKSIKDCKKSEIVSFANVLSWPNASPLSEIYDLINVDDNSLINLYVFKTGSIIGGYIAKIIPSYQVIHLKQLAVVPNLKSKSYGREMIDHIGKIGLELFGSNFMGIVSTVQCTSSKKLIDEHNKYKIRALINSGGDIVLECAKIKNQILHLVFIPYNGGLDQNEVTEIFSKIT